MIFYAAFTASQPRASAVRHYGRISPARQSQQSILPGKFDFETGSGGTMNAILTEPFVPFCNPSE
jgi:hypothetical protein